MNIKGIYKLCLRMIFRVPMSEELLCVWRFLLVIRPPDIVCRKALVSSAVRFFVRPSPRQTMQRPPIKCLPEIWSRVTLLQSIEVSPPSVPNFTGGSKSAIFGLIAQQISTLSRCRSETE